MARIVDWLECHDLTDGIVADCLSAIARGELALDLDDRTPVEAPLSGRDLTRIDDALDIAIIPALSAALGLEAASVGTMVGTIRWDVRPDCGLACTIDHGAGQPPEIRMVWTGAEADLICLAHEVGHAVQLLLSRGCAAPPIAREVCAFAAELALIDWARECDPALAVRLLGVWRAENHRYFGADVALVRAALIDAATGYDYRMNYPLARAAAVVLVRCRSALRPLFDAGAQAMALVPLARIADLAGRPRNPLPPIPQPAGARPSDDGYRMLGAMALLDAQFRDADTGGSIATSYADLLQHLQNRTLHVMLDAVRRPVAYAAWTHGTQDREVTLTRQAAPFGDHLLLQRTIERRLGQTARVRAQHMQSARPEQMAW